MSWPSLIATSTRNEQFVIKLLIVDDSALMRKLLEGIFLEEGDFEIRTARNGAEALALVRDFDPQVVTLDVQMPGMDGLACLSQIMIESPRAVVMISALTEEGTEATLEAMELGALDFVPKPSGTVSLEIDRMRPRLVEVVRGAAQARIRRTVRLTERIRHQLRRVPAAPPATRPQRVAQATERSSREPGLVLIGTSTGGPVALDMILPRLPADFPWPVMVAQHMPATFTGAFARRLDRQCAIRVIEVSRPMRLEPGTVYIGRGDADLVVARRSTGLNAMSVPAQRDYPWHPSVERLVSSALDHYAAPRLIGVLLTGMGRDGADAMTRLRREGGRTVAEAESTAIVWGMPGELVKSGGAEFIRPIDDVARTVLDMVDSNAIG
jgi:two-component system, chemotaxis family, protein-glutamate methylesterase/glutaminase